MITVQRTLCLTHPASFCTCDPGTILVVLDGAMQRRLSQILCRTVSRAAWDCLLPYFNASISLTSCDIDHLVTMNMHATLK